MSEQTKHTPTPWRYEASTKTIRSVPANYWLATMDSWDGAIDNEANADFIVKAVNNHDPLISFALYVRKFYQQNFDVMPVAFQTVDSEAERMLRDAGIE